MNITRLYEQLSRSMALVGAEWEIDGPPLALEDMEVALESALLGYSRLVPARRRLGTGVLLAPLAPGDTLMRVVGGMFETGQMLLLGRSGLSRIRPEALVVQEVSIDVPDERRRIPCLEITLVDGVKNRYGAGQLVTAIAPGLQLRAGIDTYLLPPDWIGVDEASLDLALGVRAMPIGQSGFYDGAYRQSATLSGLGYGQRSDFGAGLPPLSSIWPAISGGREGAMVSCQTQYLFDEAAPATLTLIPAPTGDRRLDFYYLGHHTLETVPEQDREALMAYATYLLLDGQASFMARREDRAAGDEKALYSKSREGLAAQAAEALARFHRLILNRPCSYGG